LAKRSLLLVDGDAKSLRVLEVSLKKAGFNVITASTGAEAMDRAKSSPPDLVISETEMAEMDGYDFCREFKKHPEWGEIPFIFLTSQTAIENKIRGLELGVDDYLTKPIYIKEILTRVRILLQKRDRANFEQKKDTNTRFAGRLSDMGVVDLIQTIEVSRKTGLIHFRADEKRQATLFFKDGRVIDAEAGHLQGEDAVYRLLTWNDGDFEALFRPVRRKPVIEMSAQALLMEGMRRLDEWGRMQEQLPPLSQKFEVVYDELWDRLSELPDEVNQILRLFDARRTLEEVIDGGNIGDLEAVEIISKLYFEGIIVEAGAATGSGTFVLEDLKIKRAERVVPADLEDTQPEAALPSSEDFGDLNDDYEPPAEAPVVEPADDSANLSAAAEAAIASARSSEDAPSETPELGGLLDRAIGEATLLDTSKRESDPKRKTSPGIAVAQIALKQRQTTVEEQLAENLIKKSRADRAGKKKGGTQPMPIVVPSADDEADPTIEPEVVDEDSSETKSTDETAVSEPVSEGEADSESVDDAPASALDSAEDAAEPAADDDSSDSAEEAAEPAADDNSSDSAEDAAEPASDDNSSDSAEDAAEPADDDSSDSADTDDKPDSSTFEVEAEYAEDDDVAPNRPFIEEVKTEGVISSGSSPDGAASGSLASKAELSPKALADPDPDESEDDAQDDADEFEAEGAPPTREQTRAIPSISQHDVDDDEEPRGFSPWLPVGIVAAAALVFVIAQGFSGDSEKPAARAPLLTETDAGSATTVVTNPPKAIADAGSPTMVATPSDAAVAPQPADAALVKSNPTADEPDDDEEKLQALLNSARKAKRQGDKLEALQLIDEALEIRRSTTALQLKAETLLALGDSKAALQVATDLTGVASRRAQAWRIRGLAAYEQKNYAEARKSFGRYLELRPSASDADDVRALLESL